MLLKLKKLLKIFTIWPNIQTAGKEDVVDLNTDDGQDDKNYEKKLILILMYKLLQNN